MGSARLRSKSLMLINGIPLVERVILIVKGLDFIDEVLVATTEETEDDIIAMVAKDNSVKI